MKSFTPILTSCAALLLLLVACDDSSPATTESPADTSATTTKLSTDIEPVKLEFLRVHLQSFHLIAEGVTEVPGYQLAHQKQHNAEDGTLLLDNEGHPRTQGFWIETAEAAKVKGYYLCEKDVASADADPARPNVIDIIFTDEGSKKMEKLTSSFEIGREMLAIVVNGKVYAAPIVQDTISRQTMINCFQIPGERDALLRSLHAATAGNCLQPGDEVLHTESDEAAADTSVD